MNALSLLVSAANAESESTSTPTAGPKSIIKKATSDASILAGPSPHMNGVLGASMAAATASHEGLAKERLATIMLQREREQQEQAAVRQATIMRLLGSGSPPPGATRPPIGAPHPGMNPHQEAEYLQRLRLDSLVQQRQQEALATLTGATADPSTTDTDLQKALLMARADEALRKQQIGQQLEQEHQRKQLEQTAMLQLMASGDNNTSAFVKALRAAKAPTGASFPNGRSSEDTAILQLLEERQRQQAIAQRLPQGRQSHFDLQQQLQHRLHGGIQGERADLVRAALASSALQRNPHQAAMPSQVLSAIVAAEEQEKQKILQLQQNLQGNHESILDQQQRLQQQALIHQRQQQQAAVLTHKQQGANAAMQEMRRPHTTVEQDAAFHDSKSTILPCRARGMPMDHNVKTAYFVIPPNMKHGTELLCSYFTCRNAGIKFRYCVHCKLPVAKRNFAKRHKHAGMKIPNDATSSNGVAGKDTNGVTEDDSTPRCIVIEEKLKAEKDDETQKEKDSSSEENLADEKPPESTNEANVASEGVASPISGDTSENSLQEETVKESPTLGDDSKTMEKDDEPTASPDEKNEVVSSNDPRPVSPKASISPSKRQEAWEKLLLLRPKGSRPNSDAMQAWIQEVLRVSDLDTELDSEGDSIGNGEMHPNATAILDETNDKKVKKSKTKALLSRKEQDDIEEEKKGDDDSYATGYIDEDNSKKDLSDNVLGKRESVPDDASTSSEESVDLRVQKKARN